MARYGSSADRNTTYPPLVHARDGELMTSRWLVMSVILLHKFVGEFQCAWFDFQQCIYILCLDFWLSQRSVCTVMSSVPYNPHDFHSGTAGLLTIKEIGSPSQRQNVGRRIVLKQIDSGLCVEELRLQQKCAFLVQFQGVFNKLCCLGERRIGDDPIAVSFG